MAKLKAGRVDDTGGFSDSMAKAIEDAMKDEWQRVKDEPLPAPLGEEDRRILFVAIARGVLNYLHAHRVDLGTNTALVDVNNHSHHLEFDIEDP